MSSLSLKKKTILAKAAQICLRVLLPVLFSEGQVFAASSSDKFSRSRFQNFATFYALEKRERGRE